MKRSSEQPVCTRKWIRFKVFGVECSPEVPLGRYTGPSGAPVVCTREVHIWVLMAIVDQKVRCMCTGTTDECKFVEDLS